MRRVPLVCMLALLVSAADSSGAVLVYQRQPSNDVVAAYANGSHPRVIAHGRSPSVSPNGRRVAFFKRRRPGAYDDLYVVAPKKGRPRLIARGVFGIAESPRELWSPDSQRVVVGDPRGYEAFVIDVRRRTRRHIPVDSFYGGASFSPSGKGLAIVDVGPRDTAISVWRADGSDQRQLATGDYPVWGRAGIAFSAGRSVVLKAGPGKRSRVLLRPPEGSFALPIAWSASGAALLAGQRETVDSVNAVLITPSTGATRQLSPTFSSLDSLSRDGKLVLAEADGNVMSVRTDNGSQRVLARGATAASWTR